MTTRELTDFHHAIRFREDICTGCSHCMNICPTEAIRVRNGKAHMKPNRCIDCGECFRVCPVGAITVEQDDFGRIRDYRARVALVPAVFSGQFPESAGPGDILAAIRASGFTHVFEVEEGVPFLLEKYREYLAGHPQVRPLISPFCPAVVRLIQVKFPTLTGHIIPMKAPVDITALHARKVLAAEGFRPEETGIFYVTPCAAKIVAVRSPVGENQSAVDGVISLQYLYNKVYRHLREKSFRVDGQRPVRLSRDAVCWSLTHGEAGPVKPAHSLAIDEINNVIEFLEKVENDEIDGIDFLELRACDESCPGGILCPANRFMTADRMRKRSMESVEYETAGSFDLADTRITTAPIEPRSMMKLDDQVAGAMVKMKRMYELNRALPQVDCGICGAPTCRALAEDIVQAESSLRQCIFVQKILEQNDKLDIRESVRIMRSIWSEKKLDRNAVRAEFPDTQPITGGQ